MNLVYHFIKTIQCKTEYYNNNKLVQREQLR
jgi:hypothetical protein